MLKNKLKTIVLFTIIALIISFSFSNVIATVDDTPSDDAPSTKAILEESSEDGIMPVSDESNETAITDNATTTDQEIYEGDLYLFDNNVTMDQLVDGNVYIFGNEVTITGQVNGNLFVFAKKLTFSGSYVRNTIYAFAGSIEFDGACNDLYVACNNMNVSYDSYIVRDVRAFTSGTLNFVGAVGRDALIGATNISFGEDENSRALIYGNLKYFSTAEIEIPEGVVTGETTFELLKSDEEKVEVAISTIILEKVLDLIKALLYTIVVFALMLWLTPKFVERSQNYVSTKAFIGFGLGLLSILVITIVGIILLVSNVGTPIGFAAITLYCLLVSISEAVVCTCIAKKFANPEKKAMLFAYLALATVAIWALKLIPFIGGIVGMFVTFTGTGIIIHYIFTKNKEISEKSE